MAFFRSILKTLISRSTKTPPRSTDSYSTSRTFFSLCSAAQPFPHRGPHNIIFRDHIFSLRQNYIIRGNFLSPLFLSSPLWKLSQYATPVLLQCDIVLLRLPKVRDSLGVPYRLEFQPTSTKLLGEREKKDRGLNGSHHANATDADTSVVNVTHSYLNLPNFISFGRLLSGPLLGWMITQEMYLPAFVGLGISGATDWLDGYLARKMRINSVVGSYLDPLADKVLIGSVALGMVHEGLLHPGLVALVLLRDAALISGAVYKRASSFKWQWRSWSDFFNLDGTNSQKVEPLLISKVNTVLQLVLVAAALLQPEFGNEETLSYITYLSWLVALTTLGSTAAYGAQHLRTGSTLKYR